MPRMVRSYMAAASSVPGHQGLKMPRKERSYTALVARSLSWVLGANYRGAG
jgi:hypothetical protein